MKYLFSILLILVLSFNASMSDDNSEKLLPKLLGASNTGKEFYLTFHPCWEDPDTNNFIRIYISSPYKTLVKLEIPAIGLVKTKETIPNMVIEFTLTATEAQAYSKGEGINPTPPQPEQVWVGRAIKITSDDPIICYGVTRYHYTSDGFLAIPVHNWGKNYQVASFADPTPNTSQFLPSYTSIIAAYDNTEVTFKLGGNQNTNVMRPNGDKISFGQTVTRTMNAGDVWLLGGIGAYNDLTGSQISADKNIGVISGNFCAYVPLNIAACDYLIEQEIPSDYWGKNYFVPSIINRKNPSIVKVFAKEPNTSISFNNVPLYNITSLNGAAGTGYIETRTSSEFNPKPVLINSDKEINVVLFNPGQQDDGVPSDPFQMNIVSDEQYQKDITFNTPGILGAYGFRDNYLNVIFKSNTNSIPDDMYFGYIENDSLHWIKLKDYTSDIPEAFKGEVPDFNGNLHYSLTIRLPKDGVYKLHAYEPFAAHGYGFSDYDSYGFPLSGGFIQQSNGDNLVPAIEIVDLGGGNYEGQINELGNPDGRVSKSSDKLQSESVSSGFSFIEMINGLSYNYKFERDDFIPGDTKAINYKVTKINPEIDSKAVIYVSDRRGNDTTIVLEDIAAMKSMTPTISCLNSDFGLLKNGQKKQLTFKVVNPGKIDSKPIEDIVFENINSGFKIISPISYPLALKVNEVIELTAEFTAGTDDGLISNNLFVKTADTAINRLTLKATVSNPTINVTDIDFGSYTIGKSSSKYDLTISNSGKTVLEIDKIEFPANKAFVIQVQQPSKENPLKIEAMSNIKLVAKFDPSDEGNFIDSVKFYSDGKIVKNVSNLTGKAILSSVEEFENKYGVINLTAKDNKISFNSGNEITLNSYTIYDLNGEIIQTGSQASLLNNYSITLNNIPNSVYFIELNTQYGKIVKKIILK